MGPILKGLTLYLLGRKLIIILCKIANPLLLWFLSVPAPALYRYGLHYNVLLEMIMSVLQEVKGLTKNYTSLYLQ